MAKASGATVISLESHPAWIAAQRRESQMLAEMRRHPAYLGRQRAAAMGHDVGAGVPATPGWVSADAPA
ncbi:hypothetical protein [Mycobacterium persicum]|uniref:Uncharacterized protein n=1 Tax=Mycobacterium persicum TaxID=1487726 RepID=A0A8E2ITQ9_9MYCO|nr:hypothetical protein [Mycobacterium persicum]ORB52678.1 hypothetical protein BST40_09135 [Mycobacterium persicum]ORB88158.1 hypothetical protein B1T49_01305 [Mycobacterium persicum]ORB93436.1 hypothetical protein B1T44_01315 [Mycobacterium persicum]ORC00194.1 hypothetical protein B1T48_01165 [Mycobacterium persicum]ORC05517.1 hypothetical protein B4U45_01315 [Mycobacterium persicum]